MENRVILSMKSEAYKPTAEELKTLKEGLVNLCELLTNLISKLESSALVPVYENPPPFQHIEANPT